MKLFDRYKQKIATLCLISVVGIFVSGTAIAYERIDADDSEDFKTILTNENISEEVAINLSDYVYIPENIGKPLISDAYYSLADDMDLRVENQGITNECWAFSVLKSMETNIALHNNTRVLNDYSERHMDYATNRTFTNGINDKAFAKEAGEGGLLVEALAYLTNGQGAVLESDMPFENNTVKIPIESIQKPVDTVVNNYYVFPAINKEYEYDDVGNTVSVKYSKSDGTEYTREELNNLRNIIKNHIVNDGAIATMTAGTIPKYYNSEQIVWATAYNCNELNVDRDHAYTIIGWNDNYSKENFAEGHKPSTDGAYLVLNSYGENAFSRGILYVSYEDYFVENEMYGIQSTVKKDYDNIYQTDFYGGIYQIGFDNTNTGYYGTTFKRNKTEKEVIDSIGVTLSSYAEIEIYLNPNGTSMDSKDLIKVGQSTGELNPGYHRIYINPRLIDSEEFAIVIKQTSSSGKFYFEIETAVENSAYSCVTSDNNSYMSVNGKDWSNLADLSIYGLDMSTSDVCIKVFTDEVGEEYIELKSDDYIVSDKYIYNVGYKTDINDFKNKLITNSKTIDIFENDNIVEDGIIKNGMNMKLSDGNEYTIIVRGDINGDGDLTLTDLSKLILHYNEMRGYELFENALKAADMSLDGKVTLTDVSQMIILYNSI